MCSHEVSRFRDQPCQHEVHGWQPLAGGQVYAIDLAFPGEAFKPREALREALQGYSAVFSLVANDLLVGPLCFLEFLVFQGES